MSTPEDEAMERLLRMLEILDADRKRIDLNLDVLNARTQLNTAMKEGIQEEVEAARIRLSEAEARLESFNREQPPHS